MNTMHTLVPISWVRHETKPVLFLQNATLPVHNTYFKKGFNKVIEQRGTFLNEAFFY